MSGLGGVCPPDDEPSGYFHKVRSGGLAAFGGFVCVALIFMSGGHGLPSPLRRAQCIACPLPQGEGKGPADHGSPYSKVLGKKVYQPNQYAKCPFSRGASSPFGPTSASSVTCQRLPAESKTVDSSGPGLNVSFSR